MYRQALEVGMVNIGDIYNTIADRFYNWNEIEQKFGN